MARQFTQESAYTRVMFQVIFKVEPGEVPKYRSQLIALGDRIHQLL